MTKKEEKLNKTINAIIETFKNNAENTRNKADKEELLDIAKGMKYVLDIMNNKEWLDREYKSYFKDEK